MRTPDVCAICGHDAWASVVGYGGAFLPCECQTAVRLAEIAAEEEAGCRRMLFDRYNFSNPELEAFYTEFDGPGALVVQGWLSGEARRARELEARGYYLWTARLLRGFFGPTVGKMAEARSFMYRAERPRGRPAPHGAGGPVRHRGDGTGVGRGGSGGAALRRRSAGDGRPGARSPFRRSSQASMSWRYASGPGDPGDSFAGGPVLLTALRLARLISHAQYEGEGTAAAPVTYLLICC